MKSDQVRKTNWIYVLGYILAPIPLAVLGVWAGRALLWGGSEWIRVCDMIPPLLAIIWWACGGRAVFCFAQRGMLKKLDAADFDRRQIFFSDSSLVAIDIGRARVAMLFFWNPFSVYELPASRVTRAWADDGAGGPSFLRSTSRVSFFFEVDGVRVRVNTFLSNQRWRMDDDRVLEGISKADQWVQVLEQARQEVSV